jgi:ATP-binding cassette subfamily B protein
MWELLTAPIIFAISLWLGIELGYRIQGILLMRFIPKLEAEIRMGMFDHIQRHSPKYFNENFAGALSNKITDMTTQVTEVISQILWMFIPAIGTSLLSLFFFYEVAPLFCPILVVLLVLYVLICIAFTKRCEQSENHHGELRSNLLGKIVDSLSNNFTVNLFYRFNHEKTFIAHFQKEEMEKNVEAKKRVEIMKASLSATFLIGGMIINGYMLFLWKQGVVTTGEIVQVFNMTWNIILVLWFVGTSIPAFYRSIGIINQALGVMRDPQDVGDPPHTPPLVVNRGEIIFDRVSFRYGEKVMFHKKDLHIKGGEKIGLVGYSGSGKSTFANLILRFFNLENGKILIDGQDIAKVTLKSLRAQVALIPQDPMLFHRSLEDNIRYGRINATKEEVIHAARLANCDSFIKKKPEGYATLVGERGTKISGGERQRIAIARAILTQAPILILDEATSALDSVTEKYIQKSLELLMKNRTTIVIAHRLSTLAKMDRILVFEHGKIVEDGSHEILLQKGGHYAKLWEMQAGGFLPDAPKKGKTYGINPV